MVERDPTFGTEIFALDREDERLEDDEEDDEEDDDRALDDELGVGEGRSRLLEIPKDKRSEANRKLTEIEFSAVLARRGIELDTNAGTPLGVIFALGVLGRRSVSESAFSIWFLNNLPKIRNKVDKRFVAYFDTAIAKINNVSITDLSDWFTSIITDNVKLAEFEFYCGILDDWEILKVYPDKSYEVWTVGELRSNFRR